MIDYLQHEREGALVLVDTSVWISSVRRPKSAVADELRLLLERDEVATTEIVIAEVLQAAKTEDDFADWSERLDALHFFPAGLATWISAGHRAFELRTAGLTTPLADVVVASVALENDLSLFAVDDDFSRISGLRLYRPRNYDVRNQAKSPGTQDE